MAGMALRGVCLLACLFTVRAKEVGVLPPTAPPWKPTWSLGRSTLSMVIHRQQTPTALVFAAISSEAYVFRRGGWSSPTHGAEFGIISYDWSNAKAQWAMQQPMDCQERLLQQAQMTKNANPSSHVLPYHHQCSLCWCLVELNGCHY